MDDLFQFLTDAVIWIVGLSAFLHLVVSSKMNETMVFSALAL